MQSAQPRYRLGELLLARKVISPQQLQQALSYQNEHGIRLGQALLKLGFISRRCLSQALSRQKWLRPCCAWIALTAPFSCCYASDDINSGVWQSNSVQQMSYDAFAYEYLGKGSSTGDVLALAAEAAWGIYNGEPEAGDWSYSFGMEETLKGDRGYQVEMTMHF